MRARLTTMWGSVAAAAGHALRHVRLVPGLAGAGLLVTAGALVHPALGFAVAGAACLAIDRRMS